MHIAAQNPLYVRREDVPAMNLRRKRKFTKTRHVVLESRNTLSIKSPKAKLESYYQMACLYDQAFVKDPNLTVKELINSVVGKIGENIQCATLSPGSRRAKD